MGETLPRLWKTISDHGKNNKSINVVRIQAKVWRKFRHLKCENWTDEGVKEQY